MSRERPAWREGTPDDTAPCLVCGEVKDLMALDRLLWCEACRFAARERAAWWGWGQGLVLGAVVAAYVFLVIRPSDLVMGGWIATVVAAVWIGARLGREIAYGVMRFTSTRPAGPPPETSPPDAPQD